MNRNFRKFSLALVGYTVLVILWGAWVRISRSGAGCGEHWPLCNGELLPGTSVPATWIEFSHRISTGLFGIFVLVLLVWAYRSFPPKSGVRKACWAALLFTILEAWIGARIVLAGLVADDTSMGRAIYMALHQVNSMLLSGSVFMVWLFASQERLGEAISWRGFLKSSRAWLPLLPLALILVISMAGAIASLASTLFPSETLAEGWGKDFSDGSHPVLRYRIWHPMLAISLGSLLAAVYWPKGQMPKLQRITRKAFVHSLTTTLIFGVSTLLLLSPVWMKLAHLMLAHLTWFSALAAAYASAAAWSSQRA